MSQGQSHTKIYSGTLIAIKLLLLLMELLWILKCKYTVGGLFPHIIVFITVPKFNTIERGVPQQLWWPYSLWFKTRYCSHCGLFLYIYYFFQSHHCHQICFMLPPFLLVINNLRSKIFGNKTYKGIMIDMIILYMICYKK